MVGLGWTLVAAIIAYLGLLAGVLYVFVFADPETNSLARYCTETLPESVWKFLSNKLGRKHLRAIEGFTDRFLVLVYLFVILGGWTVVFWYIFPWLDKQSDPSVVPTYHKYIATLVFFSCLASWRWTNTASPGLITKETLEQYNHYPYDHVMFLPNRKPCPTRHIPRLARSKFCRFRYMEHVARFDHFCGWVYNTIGQENYRCFLLFLSIHVGMCWYGTVMISRLFAGEIAAKRLFEVVFFDRMTGAEVQADRFMVYQYLFHKYMVEACLLVLMSVMGVALGLFLGFHVWITSRGLTTNESSKWDQVKAWYKRELKRYNAAVAAGQVDEVTGNEQQQSPAEGVVTDGDVTCTPGTGTGNASVASVSTELRLSHPGPPPRNIYNRGFVENWKEVLFPISLRPEYRQLGQKPSEQQTAATRGKPKGS